MKKTKVKKQKTLKKQGCSLFLLLMLLALAPVVLATVILSTTSLRLTRTNLEGSVQTTLHVTADNLAKYCKENEITAITNTVNEFRPALECGMGDSQADLKAFVEKLKASGCDTYIREIQRQLDEFLEG